MVALYSELGRYTVKIALEKGTLKKNAAQKIIALLNKYKKGINV